MITARPEKIFPVPAGFCKSKDARELLWLLASREWAPAKLVGAKQAAVKNSVTIRFYPQILPKSQNLWTGEARSGKYSFVLGVGYAQKVLPDALCELEQEIAINKPNPPKT